MPRIEGREPLAGRRKLTAVGITCGIGSMLVGARQAGFEVVGNIEWRRYYHHRDAEGRNTFTHNFPGAFFVESADDLDEDQSRRASGCDIALGHPECGNFSLLGGSLKNRADRMKDPCDIPLFVDLVARLRPKFFVMDDLPKSFGAFPMSEYASRLRDYDLFPEWVSNWGYGNIQRYRNRMFVVGSLRSERWAFTPGEVDHETTVRGVIGDLGRPGARGALPNHDPHDLDSICGRFTNVPRRGDQWRWGDMGKVLGDFPEGKNIVYISASGEEKVRFGSCKVRWDGPSAVLHGGNPILHPHTCLPLSIRERARIQGFPDDFVFYGTRLDDRGRWNHEREGKMVKQTGKAMPVQFCRYVATQVYAHLTRSPFRPSGKRIIKPNPLVDGAKRWYCSEVGYSDQALACSRCWMAEGCDIRRQKYGIGPPLFTKEQVGVVFVSSTRQKRRIRSLDVVDPPPPKPIPPPRPDPLPRVKSSLVGRKVGVGQRMVELLDLGVPDAEIAVIVRREFPGSSATTTDVGKVRAKLVAARSKKGESSGRRR